MMGFDLDAAVVRSVPDATEPRLDVCEVGLVAIVKPGHMRRLGHRIVRESSLAVSDTQFFEGLVTKQSLWSCL